MQDNLPGVNVAFDAPRVVPPNAPAFQPAAPPPVQRSQPVPPASPRPAGGEAALWQAFCEGAGLHLPLPADPAQAAERMRQVGLVLRAAVAGTRELMAVRASTKYEMRASVTQIQAKSNNPLKFAPDVKTGIEQLVQPATRGFLDGPAAMDDAMRDLVGHSIGSVAGMRAALEGLLDRFDPATLESTLGGSMLDNLLPLNRRSRLWELYLQKFRAIREEAQEDFHALFGKAFVAAYEQQVARLKQGEQGAPRRSP
jgi:FHA domain-containing protein